MGQATPEKRLRGIGVSAGIAIGPARIFGLRSLDIHPESIGDPAAELARYDEAVAHVRRDLLQLQAQTAKEIGQREAAIFDAHLAILDDPALRPEVERNLELERLNVEYIVQEIIAGYARLLEQLDDSSFRERSTDLVDVGRRIQAHLLGEKIHTLDRIDTPCIVVAHELAPSETAAMDKSRALGLATDAGGPTSHMAIIARAFDIPSVVGLRHLGDQVRDGDTLILDGARGHVIIHPSKATLTRYEAEKKNLDEIRTALLQATGEGCCVTQDGTDVPTYANIELLAETQMCLRVHAQGIGLFRTEFLFMDRDELPTEEEQYIEYRKIMEAMSPLPVTVRTLDVGGDKEMPLLTADHETNPQLGWRSIRLCLDRPDIFKAQLRALLRAGVHGDLRIMFPMITSVEQFLEARTMVDEVADDLHGRNVEYKKVPVGTMIEVPAAVTIADHLSKHCDFLSIGTNDLIQYCLAVDRANERTAHLYQPTHPAVLRMIKQALDAANDAKIPCNICGEMAGDPTLTELLIGLGFRALSMSSSALPAVRAEIVNTDVATAKRFAKKLLRLSSAPEIRELIAQRNVERDTLNRLRRGVSGSGR
jgi:phosphotransferase system enzyme I (PtsI)